MKWVRIRPGATIHLSLLHPMIRRPSNRNSQVESLILGYIRFRSSAHPGHCENRPKEKPRTKSSRLNNA